MEENLKSKVKEIKALILDVDGILTNGKVIYSDYGEELKSFDIQDGLALNIWKKLGYNSAIITARNSKIVKKRAKEMGISIVYEGRNDKIKSYNKIKAKLGLKDEEICYLGDDLLDLAVMEKAGLGVTVPNACEEVKERADFITKKNGGDGAVREVVELILKLQGRWQEIIDSFIKS